MLHFSRFFNFVKSVPRVQIAGIQAENNPITVPCMRVIAAPSVRIRLAQQIGYVATMEALDIAAIGALPGYQRTGFLDPGNRLDSM